MFTTVLVALDQSPAAPPILARLADLKSWGVKHVILTHIIRVGYNQFTGYSHEEDYRAWLEKCAEPLREAGLDVKVSLRIAGTVAEEVLAIASEFNVDLILAGSRSQSWVSNLFLGSVARDLIRKSTRPVLMEWIKPGSDDTEPLRDAAHEYTLEHLLFATDLSKHARGAENAARELSARANQTDLLTVFTPEAQDNTPAIRIMVKAALEDLRQRLPSEAARVSVLTEKGEPAEVIKRVAEERDCSLIIIGKHGQGWLESKFIDTTATALCETTQHPILLVP